MKPVPSASQSTPRPPGDVFLAHVPFARLQELHHGDPPVAGDRAHHDAERRGRLALAVAGVHHHDRARGVGAFGKMVLFGWFDGCHVRLGRTFPGREGPSRASAMIVLSATLVVRLCGERLRRRRAAERHSCRPGSPGRPRRAWSTAWAPASVTRPAGRARAIRPPAELKAERATPARACGVIGPARLVPGSSSCIRKSGWSSRPCGGELLGAARLAVDHADDGPEHRALRPELDRGVEDRAARGHDVFDDAEPLPVELAALGEPAGAVGLGLLADEAGRAGRSAATSSWRAGSRRARARRGRRSRPAPAGTHAVRDGAQQARVRLEQVLVEVLVAHHARAQRERPGEVRSRRRSAPRARGGRSVGGTRRSDGAIGP